MKKGEKTMGKIVLLLIVTPIIDLYILIKASQTMGFWTTILLIILTGIAGFFLAKSEGKVILSKIKRELSQGSIPGEDILNGFCILIGGILLLTPGILTDIIGITMVLPGTRNLYLEYIRKRFTNIIKRGDRTFLFRWY